MDNIICVGCSWTYGYGLKSKETYCSFLEKVSSPYQIINAGHCGADINYSIFSATKLIEKYRPKIVIFQLTSFDRITLGTDGFNNFLNNDFNFKNQSSCYYDETDDNNIRLIGINDGIKTKYTQGSYIATEKDRIKELKFSGIKKTNSEKYKNFLDVLFENVIYSDYEIDKVMNNLFLFKNYLKYKNIKSLWFFWLPNPDKEYFKIFLQNESYIEMSVFEWLESKYPENNFFIDNGFHISEKGNKILAEEYLLPYLSEML